MNLEDCMECGALKRENGDCTSPHCEAVRDEGEQLYIEGAK